MMNIADIYAKFDQIGCLTFATIDRDTPQTRMAHLRAHDEEGLYFQTMIIKPFYVQLKHTGKVSICGMFPKTSPNQEEDLPYFSPGYAIRATGDVREVSFETLKAKAAINPMFEFPVEDIERYPAMTTFCLYRAWGEVFDFDFTMARRPHKLLRTSFCFGGASIPFRGVRITDACIACGKCQERCSFKAIAQHDAQFVVDHAKCDVCGDCYLACPANAIEIINGSEDHSKP